MDQAGEHERPPRSRTGLIVWISGTARPGDTQLSSELSRMLAETRHVEVLDAHVVQHQLTPGHRDSLSNGFVPDRSLAWIAYLLSRHGVSAVVALASPCNDTRREVQARAAAEGLRFVDIALNGMESREVLIDQVTELLRESGSEARDEISRRAGAKSESSIVVVRDRDPAALQNPPRGTFGDRGAVTYLRRYARRPAGRATLLSEPRSARRLRLAARKPRTGAGAGRDHHRSEPRRGRGRRTRPQLLERDSRRAVSNRRAISEPARV